MWAFYASWDDFETISKLPQQREIYLDWRIIKWTWDELMKVIQMVAESNIEWEKLWTFVDEFLHFKNSQSLTLGNAVALYRKQIMSAFHENDDVPFLID